MPHSTALKEEGQLYFYHSFHLIRRLTGPSGRPRRITPGFSGFWLRKVNPSLVGYSPLIAGLMQTRKTLFFLYGSSAIPLHRQGCLPSFTLPVSNSSRNISLEGFTSNVMRPFPAARSRVPSATVFIDWQIRAVERMMCCLMECCQYDVCRVKVQGRARWLVVICLEVA